MPQIIPLPEHRAEAIRRALAWAQHASLLCGQPPPDLPQIMALAAARMRYLALLLPAEQRIYMDLARYFDSAARDAKEAGQGNVGYHSLPCPMVNNTH